MTWSLPAGAGDRNLSADRGVEGARCCPAKMVPGMKRGGACGNRMI